MKELVLDFETASAAALEDVGAWRYAEDITTEILCLCWSIDGCAGSWTPGINDEALKTLKQFAEDPEVLFIAHNAGFEKAIWRHIMVPFYGLPDLLNHRWDDTMAACAMRALPLKLERAADALRLPTRKDTEGSAFTTKLSKPNRKGYYDRSPASLERVLRYCQQDIQAEKDLRERVGPLTPGERNVWLLDQRINERGVLLDMAFVEKAQQVVDRASLPLVEEFARITGGLKVTQTAKFKEWIDKQGVWIDSLSKETVAAILGEEPEEDAEEISAPVELPENVRRALFIRSLIGSASVKKLHRMRVCVGSDNRARGLLQYHGASPGRWAGRLLQPQNFPRGTLVDNKGDKFDPSYVVHCLMSGDPDTVQKTLGPPIESVVSALRHAIIASPGKVLMSGDFAGVEARMVLALSRQYDKTAIMAAGQDVYCDMAQQIYKRPIDKKKDPEQRQTGKNAVLGLGFQMGWKKFKMKYGKGLSESFCQNVVDVYRKQWAPNVPLLWEALGEAALSTAKGEGPHEAYGVLYQMEDRWLTARLPSGRKLWYFNPRIIKRAMPWDETDVRIAWCYQQMKTGQLKTIDAFGGLLTENAVQALARDLMVHAMFNLEKHGFPVILTVHDEIVCEPWDTKSADEEKFAQIMCDIPAWAKKLQVPVAVETWKGDRYKK